VYVTDVDGYVRTRESGRLIQFVIFLPFTLVIAFAVSLRIGGLGEISVILGVILLELLCIAAWVRKPSPSVPVDLAQPYSTGSWSASAPVFDFPEVAASNPRLRPTSSLFGHFILEPSGARWDPSQQTVRSFGAVAVSWGPEWTIRAKGVRGFGGQVQLTLEKPGTQSIVVWLRRARDLHMR
jgi:hypothetical protein